MVERNKHRLYIAVHLPSRGRLPGYNLALLLAPTLKSESADIEVKDCHIFHATNLITKDYPLRGGDSDAAWRFEDKPVNSLESGNHMIARILVAKLSPSVPLADLAKSIRMVVQHVHVINGDPNWTCRVWVVEALGALRALGGQYSVIPEITDGGAFDKDIEAFGDEALATHKASTKDLTHVKDLPHKDIRVKR
ncbi:hypothetical protein JB92DRAFT_2728863 [Gautieria morchelliformis]|nr:hypothetical protein JB92DRAFT_2728863 [Gautieria morchelliformis]